MSTSSFNDGWSVQPKKSIFEALQGAGSDALPVRLPHDALIHTARSAGTGRTSHTGYFPSAAVEYVKTFEVPEDYRHKRVTVTFQGVYRDAMVFMNGVFAAQRPFGYATFSVRLDPFLNYGTSNTIRVEARTHEDSRWYTGVGIYRDTLISVTELVHLGLNPARITTPDIEPQRAVVEVATTVHNESTETRQLSLTTTLQDEGRAVATDTAPVTLRAGATSTVRQRLYVSRPRLWDTNSPTLYTATSALHEDISLLEAQATNFGIRKLQLDPNEGLRINGARVKLRGACIHHDNGILGSATIGRAEERRVQLLKNAGFNAVRSAHNPLSQAMLDACDRIGMLVMDETFDMWAESKSAFDYSLSFPEWWERDVEALVEKDFNHPSVIFYSIGNEIPETGTPLGSDWGRKIAEKIRSMDGTRFLTNSINGFVSVLPEVVEMMKQHGDGQAPEGVNAAGDFMGVINASALVSEKTAESFSVVDVAGLNYGDSRYLNDREDFPNRIIVGSETFPGKIDSNWRLVQENAHVIGDFTWTGWDYLGEAGIGRMQYLQDDEQPAFAAPYPWVAAWCGDIDITGNRRPVSFYRETVFGLRHTPYIAVQRPEHHGKRRHPSQWTWSDSLSSWSWNVKTGAPVTVEVYSDADEVELVLNGRSLGRTPAGQHHAFRAEFEVRYEPGELTAAAITNGVVTGTTTLLTATGEVQLAVEADRQQLTNTDSELSFVTIELRDTEGNLINDFDRPVTVEVTGAGVLQALGSARPDTDESFDATTFTTFDGRLLAIVRPTTAGTIHVGVTAGDLAAQHLVLTVAPARADTAPLTAVEIPA